LIVQLSVALNAGEYVMVPELELVAVVNAIRLVGQLVIVGGSDSSTETVKEHLLVLLRSSTAVHVTLVTPMENVVPLAGEQ